MSGRGNLTISDGSGTSMQPLDRSREADEQQSDFPDRFVALLAIADQSYGDELENLFTNCNFQVTRTSSASDAKKLLEEDGENFNFVLFHASITTDIKIISGLISFAKCRKKNYVIFLFTNEVILAQTAKVCGADFCYCRPLTVDDVKQNTKVMQWLTKRRIKYQNSDLQASATQVGG